MGDNLVVSLEGGKGTKSNLIEFKKFSDLFQILENVCKWYNANRKYRCRNLEEAVTVVLLYLSDTATLLLLYHFLGKISMF